MKSGDRPSRLRSPILLYVYRSLIICLALLGVALIGGTIYGVFFRATPPRHDQIALPNNDAGGQTFTTFTGIGQIRVPTADPQPGMVILFVSFVYNPDDRAFSEELALRVRNFREIIADYIGSFSATELQDQDEESIKSELLRRFNAILRLGQLETLYFSDFMIL